MNLISTIVILIYRKDINDRQDYLVVIFTPNSKPNDLTPHLSKALKSRKVKNIACLDMSEFSLFLEHMNRYHGNLVIRSALQFMTLTFVRTAQLRMMEWNEIDLWRIPAHKMKMAMPHIEPLSKQALKILKN